MWQQLALGERQMWLSLVLGKLSAAAPPATVTGGFLCDEMGLGERSCADGNQLTDQVHSFAFQRSSLLCMAACVCCCCCCYQCACYCWLLVVMIVRLKDSPS
jgi:hypothetical protein